MKDVELAYIAGIIDGEGTVTLSKRHGLDYRYPVISVSSTTYGLLMFLKEKCGGCISKQKVYSDKHKQSWSWKLQSRPAIKLAEKLIPYLLEPDKKRRCNLLVHEFLSVTPRNGKYSDELRQAKLRFQEKFFHPSDA